MTCGILETQPSAALRVVLRRARGGADADFQCTLRARVIFVPGDVYDQQEGALRDYKEAAVMMRFNMVQREKYNNLA